MKTTNHIGDRSVGEHEYVSLARIFRQFVMNFPLGEFPAELSLCCGAPAHNAPSKSRLAAIEYKLLAARISIFFPHSFSFPPRIIALSFTDTFHTISLPSQHLNFNSQVHQKWPQKSLRRSLLPQGRRPLARPLPRRRKPARRRPPPQVTRRNATRREKRHIPPTSTKVSSHPVVSKSDSNLRCRWSNLGLSTYLKSWHGPSAILYLRASLTRLLL